VAPSFQQTSFIPSFSETTFDFKPTESGNFQNFKLAELNKQD
jgi:hypothetical protein